MNDMIVACARGWIGTRFHHQGRLKKTHTHKGGVDCLGLLVGVAHELKLHTGSGIPLASFDEIHYSHSPDSARLLKKLSDVLTEIPPEGIQPGDVLLMNINHNPQHLAIVTPMQEGLGIIHAYAPARAVVEHVLDDWWRERIEKAFHFSL